MLVKIWMALAVSFSAGSSLVAGDPPPAGDTATMPTDFPAITLNDDPVPRFNWEWIPNAPREPELPDMIVLPVCKLPIVRCGALDLVSAFSKVEIVKFTGLPPGNFAASQLHGKFLRQVSTPFNPRISEAFGPDVKGEVGLPTSVDDLWHFYRQYGRVSPGEILMVGPDTH